MVNQNDNEDKKSVSDIGRVFSVTGNLLVTRLRSNTCPRQFVGTQRESISAFSEGSRQRMRQYLRECMSEYRHFVTLTYPNGFPSDGRAVKEHLRRFLQEHKRACIRNKCDKSKYSSFWFLEFQRRGAPHFHIFTTEGFDKRSLSELWYRIVGSEDERHLRAGTNIEEIRLGRAGIASYAAKYAAKGEQKEVPEGYEDVGRFWGVVGRKSVMAAATFLKQDELRDGHARVRVDELSRVLRAAFKDGSAIKIVQKSGTIVCSLNHPELLRKVYVQMALIASAVGRFRWQPELFDEELAYYVEEHQLMYQRMQELSQDNSEYWRLRRDYYYDEL